MKGRRHGRGGAGVGSAGGCRARARRHMPTSGGRRWGAVGEGWESLGGGLAAMQQQLQVRETVTPQRGGSNKAVQSH